MQCTFHKIHLLPAHSPSLGLNPEETSPEIPNRDASGPKRGHVHIHQKNFLKRGEKKLYQMTLEETDFCRISATTATQLLRDMISKEDSI